jgi:phosphomethylpyrimidine synthase
MKITQDVRDYADGLSDNEKQMLYPHPEKGASAPVSKDEAEEGMAAMSEKYREMGSEIYLEADAVKRANGVL